MAEVFPYTIVTLSPGTAYLLTSPVRAVLVCFAPPDETIATATIEALATANLLPEDLQDILSLGPDPTLPETLTARFPTARYRHVTEAGDILAGVSVRGTAGALVLEVRAAEGVWALPD